MFMGNILLWNLEVSIILPAQLHPLVKEKKSSILVMDLMEQGELCSKLSVITQSNPQCTKRPYTHDELDLASFLALKETCTHAFPERPTTLE